MPEAVSDSGESDEEVSLSEDELKRGMVENLRFFFMYFVSKHSHSIKDILF